MKEACNYLFLQRLTDFDSSQLSTFSQENDRPEFVSGVTGRRPCRIASEGREGLDVSPWGPKETFVKYREM